MSRLLVPDRNFPEADLRPTAPPHFNLMHSGQCTSSASFVQISAPR